MDLGLFGRARLRLGGEFLQPLNECGIAVALDDQYLVDGEILNSNSVGFECFKELSSPGGTA